jgi:MscS family membrane protein
MVGWFTEIFSNTLRDYVIFFGIIAFGMLIGKTVSWTLQNIIKSFASKTATKIDDVIVEVLEGPFIFAIFVAMLAFAKRFLVLSPAAAMGYGNIISVLSIIMIAWFIIRFLDSVIRHYVTPYAAKTKTDLDDVLIPLLQTFVKVVVISLSAIMILSDFGYNVSGLVAGLGIGGLAVALAAKDILGNIFGGVSVIADKPFKIGDMIKFETRQGTVRQIGLRTTRIETLDGTQLIVPNAKFTDGIIENITNRNKHRVSLILNLQYDTSLKKINQAKKVLKEIIKKHKGTQDEATVYFSNFGPHSVDLTLIYFVSDLKSISQAQDEVNMEIKEAFEKAKIEFAYPTQTVILKKR